MLDGSWPTIGGNSARMVVSGHLHARSDGHVDTPICCGAEMADAGGCPQGCCDDFKCEACGLRVRVEWPA